MKIAFDRLLGAAALAAVSAVAHAAPVAWGGEFALYDPISGSSLGGNNDVTGYIDTAAGTWSVASVSPFYGFTWSATGGTLYGPGTHVVNVNGDGQNAFSGNGNVTFTVGAGQLGGNINMSWNGNSGIDVFQVWSVVTVPGVGTVFTSLDADGDGVPGMAMIDGPFVGLDVVFNMAAPVPEPSAYAMLLAGLGLVGSAVVRRKGLSSCKEQR